MISGVKSTQFLYLIKSIIAAIELGHGHTKNPLAAEIRSIPIEMDWRNPLAAEIRSIPI